MRIGSKDRSKTHERSSRCMICVQSTRSRFYLRRPKTDTTPTIHQNSRFIFIYSAKIDTSTNTCLLSWGPASFIYRSLGLTPSQEIPAKPAHALSPQGLQRFVQHLAPELVCVLSDDAGALKRIPNLPHLHLCIRIHGWRGMPYVTYVIF